MKTLFLLLLSMITTIQQSHRSTIQSDNHADSFSSSVPSSNQTISAIKTIQQFSNQTIKQYSHQNHPAIQQSNHQTIITIKQSNHHQTDTLPNLPSLHSSIDAYFHAQTQLQLLEFKDTKKGEWLKFLPNLGITYALDGQPRPSISLSSGIFYQARKVKQQKATKRQHLLQTQLLAAEQAKSQLVDLILQYEQLQREYLTQQELFIIETDLFLIKQEEYERQELAPSDFLQAKRTYLLQQQAVTQKRHQLDRLISKIKLHCHYQE